MNLYKSFIFMIHDCYLCNHIDLFNPNILHPPFPRAHALHGSRPTSTALAAPAAAVPAAVRRRTGGAKDNGARAPSTGIVHHGQVVRWSGGQVVRSHGWELCGF